MTIPLFIRAMSDDKLQGEIDKFVSVAVSFKLGHGSARPASLRPEDSPYWSGLLRERERRQC